MVTKSVGDGFVLESEAAAAWNSMAAEGWARWGRQLRIRDAKRICGNPGDYSKGVWSQWAAREAYLFHDGPLAADPNLPNCGSVHVLGRAVDCFDSYTRWVVDKIGAKYGWYWGAAPSEWWHVQYYGGFTGADVGPVGLPSVEDIQARLKVWLPGNGVTVDGQLGPKTKRAIERFQLIHRLPVDGTVGLRTWALLRRADVLAPAERKAVNEYVLAVRNKLSKATRREHWREVSKLRKSLWRYARKHGWTRSRRARYNVLAKYTLHRKSKV